MDMYQKETIAVLQPAALKNQFARTLAMTIGKLAKRYPKEEAYAMPVLFNVPLLIHRMRQILTSYDLPMLESPSKWNLMGFMLQGEGMSFSCHIEYRTFNGMMVILTDEQEPSALCSRVLSDRQSVILIKDLIQTMQQTDNPLCRLFAADMTNLVYDMLLPEEHPDEKKVLEELDHFLLLF